VKYEPGLAAMVIETNEQAMSEQGQVRFSCNLRLRFRRRLQIEYCLRQ
jgi:hypothetical protein